MTAKEKIAFYLEDIENPIGIAVNLSIVGLIFLSLVMFVAETYSIPNTVRVCFHYIDITILFLFSFEYLLRFWCATSKVKFLFSLFSIVDLLAIVPMFVGFMDARFLRLFRWFRILRILRFIDFEVSIFRLKTEDGIILARILLTLFSIVFIYSGLIYQIEHQVNPEVFKSFFDALYFSVVTMTTVGFGDVIPLSQIGRVLTLMMIVTGVLIIPWQVRDLIEQLLKTIDKVDRTCSQCGLAVHDRDANFCKICGFKLE